MRKSIRKGAIVEYVSNNNELVEAYGIYFKVWKKEGQFTYLESLKNSIGKCTVPCSKCKIVNM